MSALIRVEFAWYVHKSYVSGRPRRFFLWRPAHDRIVYVQIR